MSNRLFAPPTGKTFLEASPVAVDAASVTNDADTATAASAVTRQEFLGDSDWTSATVSVRVQAASVDFEMEAGRVAEWFKALVPRFKRAVFTCTAGVSTAASSSDSDSGSLKEVQLPPALLKGAASVCALHVFGCKTSVRFSIVATDTRPSSLAFVGSHGNWFSMGSLDVDADVTSSFTSPATREARLLLSVFEYGGLVLTQGLCEALCVQGTQPGVVVVGTPTVMALADRVQFAVTSTMALMCDTPADAGLPPAVTVPIQESAVCADPEMEAVDPETDKKMRRENIQLHTAVQRLKPDASVALISSAFVWFARINMTSAALIALLDFVNAAWVPPPDAATAAIPTNVMTIAQCSVKTRSASTEALIRDVCRWIAIAPARWKTRFINLLKTYTQLVTNKWK